MKGKLRLTLKGRHFAEGYSFVALWTIGFLVFMAIPLVRSLLYSFQDLKVNSGRLQATWVGLQNYRQAFTVDVEFTPILTSTMLQTIFNVPLILIFSMFSAILLNRPMKGRIFFRGVFFLPVIIAAGETLQKLTAQGAATLPIFQQYDLKSVLQDYIPLELLTPLLTMMDSLTLVMWGAGVPILILLAGLQTISPSLYEAAKCDGATPWENFWKITFPMIMPMLLVSTLFCIVDSFTSVMNKMMKYIYTLVFNKFNYGYASAVGWIYFIFIFLVIGVVFFLFRNTTAVARDRR
ncbi:carbohydrate ABC transporter permease [Paenibacillus ginsengarvi]|uniref:Sugar ABC transporter permease n=1 Tax=Paenibacillus ginsengarvi TaxID=400777 RepID=A0A3B0BCN5_9BACL|nr:sugar ABC transporter permease [Paenibacillus ginsengarvi]RKN70141.1 sugar ABC transporter permease [Paenibacillus ginsengarvi]